MYLNGSIVRFVQSNNQFQKNTLSRAASTQYGDRFTLSDLQVNSIQDSLPAETFMEVLHDDCWAGIFLHSTSYGKNTMMNRTSTTSARMMKSEESTTELVAARPTPSVPPRTRIP